jgi:bifunctional NMN adenylyltransferase/nudix hydrolase
MKYDTSIIVGSFQPLHSGHIELIKKALFVSSNLVIFIGYSGFTDLKHFIDPDTISEIILEHFEKEKNRIFIKKILNTNSNSYWIHRINAGLLDFRTKHNIDLNNICFSGGLKDFNLYQDLFKNHEYDFLLLNNNDINATEIRQEYFLFNRVNEKLPEVTKNFLEYYKRSKLEEFIKIQSIYLKYYK